MGGRGRTDLLQLADNAELRYGHTAAQRGAAHIGAGVNAVFARLKHPGGLMSGHASVVVACERGEREGERERFRFAGSERARFAEGGEHAGIFRRHPYADRVALRFCSHLREREACVAQTEAERELDRFRGKRLEVAVANVNVLGVAVEVLAEKIPGARVILVALCDGIRQLAAGVDFSGEHVRRGVAALHAALPHEKSRADRVLVKPRQIHHAARVNDNGHAGEGGRYLREERFFLLCQVIAAGFERILARFACRPPDDDQGGSAARGRLVHGGICERHLLKVPRPRRPLSHVGRVLRAPVGVDGGERLVDPHPGGAQSLDQVDRVGGD